jgi:hypothetical protein
MKCIYESYALCRKMRETAHGKGFQEQGTFGMAASLSDTSLMDENYFDQTPSVLGNDPISAIQQCR